MHPRSANDVDAMHPALAHGPATYLFRVEELIRSSHPGSFAVRVHRDRKAYVFSFAFVGRDNCPEILFLRRSRFHLEIRSVWVYAQEESAGNHLQEHVVHSCILPREGNCQMKTTMISSWMHEDTFVDKTLFPRAEPVLSPLCAVRAMYSF